MNLMDNLPVQRHSEPEVIEPEVVGYEKQPSWWQRFKSRALLSLIIGIVGLVLCVVGALLTISIIGVVLGIPLLLFGIAAIVMAVYLFLGGGNLKVISFGSYR